MTGNEFVQAIKKKIIEGGQSGTDTQIAGYLGVTPQAITNWRGGGEMTVRQIVGLLGRFEKRVKERVQTTAIAPVVEFFKLAPVTARGGRNKEIFGAKKTLEGAHPYLLGLRAELEQHHGVYIFYDSRGRALYVGQARTQTLWKEINLAFNRDRDVQKIWRVGHPTRRQDFRNSDEVRRKIQLQSLPLCELAHYLSAYSVDDGFICEVESMLIRGFPNDLLNARMENLTWTKSRGRSVKR